MLTIPPFYRRKDATSSSSLLAMGNPVNPQDLRRLARVMHMKKKAHAINLDDQDFTILFMKLMELSEPRNAAQNLKGKTMSYDQFISLSGSEELHPVFRKELFTASKYFMFPKSVDGFIYSDCILSCAEQMREQRKVRYDLALIDKENTGHLTEMQLVEYFDQFMREVPDDHLDFYIAVVVRKFMFFLERDKKVAIRDLMSSPILTEFKQRFLSERNWFNGKNIYGLYNTFLDLDQDRNMFLSKHEFMQITFDGENPLPRITPMIVDRLFARKITPTENNPNAELDFRNFLDFVLAFQSKGHPASLKYFWELMDFHNLGYLTVADVHELVREVFNTLGEETVWAYAGGNVVVDDVKDEIFDMARASTVITFDDFVKCGHGATIISVLTDPSGFLSHEQREMQLQNAQQRAEAAGDYVPAESDDSLARAAGVIFGSGDAPSGTSSGAEGVTGSLEGGLMLLNIHQGATNTDEDPQDYV